MTALYQHLTQTMYARAMCMIFTCVGVCMCAVCRHRGPHSSCLCWDTQFIFPSHTRLCSCVAQLYSAVLRGVGVGGSRRCLCSSGTAPGRSHESASHVQDTRSPAQRQTYVHQYDCHSVRSSELKCVLVIIL